MSAHGSGEGGARRRAQAARTRAAIVGAARRLSREEGRLSMERVAALAGVSRATLYRHFPNAEAVRRAVLADALARVERRVRAAARDERAPLARLREVIDALASAGSAYGLDRLSAEPLGRELDDVADLLLPLARRMTELAGLAPGPPDGWLRRAVAAFVERCLREATPDADPASVAERVFTALTDPLDRGIAIVDRDGGLLAVNAAGRAALALDPSVGIGEPASAPRTGTLYEDLSRCPPESYPLALALSTGRSEREAVRAHRDPDGAVRWFAIDAFPLRRAPAAQLDGAIAVFTEISERKRAELAQLLPPGTLGRKEPLILDAARVLDAIPPYLFPDQLVAEGRRLVESPVALYVLDIDGSHLLRLAGTDEFPERIEAPLALGPELAQNGIPELRARLEAELPGAVLAPMWLRGRAVGVLLALGGSEAVLSELGRQGAAAMELVNGYTDVLDAARRRKEINPAAEIQQSLLPPRIARLGGAEIGCSVLPSYEVGGDWLDYVENRDGAWIAIADAAGKGPRAGALGGIALAALRAARRNEQGLEEAARTVHETVFDIGNEEFYVTAVIARWDPAYSLFSWVNAGHPAPLLLHADGSLEALVGERTPPFGMLEREREFRRSYRRLAPDDRVVLYSDGISRRRTRNGFFGTEGIAQAARSAPVRATETARAIQEAVVAASSEPLRDDAAILVLTPRQPGAH